jgi:hypothetical protein
MLFKINVWFVGPEHDDAGPDLSIDFDGNTTELVHPKQAIMNLTNSLQAQMAQTGCIGVVDTKGIAHVWPRERIARVEARYVDALPNLMRN